VDSSYSLSVRMEIASAVGMADYFIDNKEASSPNNIVHFDYLAEQRSTVITKLPSFPAAAAAAAAAAASLAMVE